MPRIQPILEWARKKFERFAANGAADWEAVQDGELPLKAWHDKYDETLGLLALLNERAAH
jgi:hypothetical protein